MQIAEETLARVAPARRQHIPLATIAGSALHIPLAYPAVNMEPQNLRKVGCADCEPFEIVPPEFAVDSDIAGRNVNRRRQARCMQDRKSALEIIEIAVIESDDHPSSREIFARPRTV